MIRINLLPVREEKRKADVRNQLLLMGLCLVVALGGLAAYHITLRGSIERAHASVVQLDAQLAEYQVQLAQVEEFRKKKTDIETKLGVIKGLERARSGPVHMLDEIAIHAPDRLWLTSLEATTSSVQIEGMALDNERLAQFLTRLESSLYFTNVELQGTEFEDVRGLKLAHFTVAATLAHPEAEETASAGSSAVVAGR